MPDKNFAAAEVIGGGFDRVIEGLMFGDKLRQRKRQEDLGRLGFMAQTGHDPNRLVSGMNLAGQPQAGLGADDLSLVEEYKNFTGLLQQKQQLGQMKTAADIDYTRARTDALRSTGQGGDAEIVTLPGSNMQFLRQMTSSGPRFTPLPGQSLGSELVRLSESAQSGLRNIATIRGYLKSPRAKALTAKAGGFGHSLLSVGDTDAQKLRTAISEASDVITRLRTGAALNAQEEEYYSSLLTNRWRTVEGNLDALNVVEQFLKGVNAQVQSGIRAPGKQFAPLIIPLKGKGKNEYQQAGQDAALWDDFRNKYPDLSDDQIDDLYLDHVENGGL